MIAKVTSGQSSDLYVRRRQLNLRESLCGNRLTAIQYSQLCMDCRRRSLSHSSMKAENWFQLRVFGVTSIKPGFGRAFFLHELRRSSQPQRFSSALAR